MEEARREARKRRLLLELCMLCDGGFDLGGCRRDGLVLRRI